jgi:hypothetical protein
MISIYKTLYNKNNKDAEYQKRGKTWYKRKKGSKEKWYKVEEKYFDSLNSQQSGFLYNYNTASKIVAGTLLAFIVYKVVKSRK